ncbi:MAG: VOC family protein [Flavobacteriales bacterium]|nr:VOC family protein [Flavobacteriales bacterium]
MGYRSGSASGVSAADRGRITGIGGVFFKSADPRVLRGWYAVTLGVDTDQYGTNFEWRQAADSTLKGFTQWSPFQAGTKYFAPSTKDFMVNYRVDDMDELVVRMRRLNVTILDTVETFDYGKFLHIMDPEGNKIELWEPVDEIYDGMVEGRTR